MKMLVCIRLNPCMQKLILYALRLYPLLALDIPIIQLYLQTLYLQGLEELRSCMQSEVFVCLCRPTFGTNHSLCRQSSYG